MPNSRFALHGLAPFLIHGLCPFFASNSRFMRLFQAALNTPLDSPFSASLSIHGLHFTVCAPSNFSSFSSFFDPVPKRLRERLGRLFFPSFLGKGLLDPCRRPTMCQICGAFPLLSHCRFCSPTNDCRMTLCAAAMLGTIETRKRAEYGFGEHGFKHGAQ